MHHPRRRLIRSVTSLSKVTSIQIRHGVIAMVIGGGRRRRAAVRLIRLIVLAGTTRWRIRRGVGVAAHGVRSQVGTACRALRDLLREPLLMLPLVACALTSATVSRTCEIGALPRGCLLLRIVTLRVVVMGSETGPGPACCDARDTRLGEVFIVRMLIAIVCCTLVARRLQKRVFEYKSKRPLSVYPVIDVPLPAEFWVLEIAANHPEGLAHSAGRLEAPDLPNVGIHSL